MDHYFHKKLLLIISLLFLVSISTIATESPTSSPSAAPESSPPNLKSESPNLQPESSSSSSASPNLQPESSSSSSASPNLQPESSSSGSPSQSPAFPPSSHVSFPPSGSDAPSPSMSSSSELDSPDSPDANRNTEPEDSPDSYVPEEETPEGPDGEIPSSVPSSSSKSESESESDSDSSDPPLKEEITDKNANPEVKKACGSTDYPNLCINTLDPIISPKKEVTLDTVLKVSIKATNDLAKAAKVMATKLAAAPGTPPELTKVLNDCKESYDSALYNFERAMEAYDTHDVGTMNTMLSAVITDVGDCEDEFSAVNIPSPVAEFAQKLANMTRDFNQVLSVEDKLGGSNQWVRKADGLWDVIEISELKVLGFQDLLLLGLTLWRQWYGTD
ncbi:hypothetical protein M9H77_36919 [Catharanthus roseus]|uniref:Uncharacterized protein n=1 Tax=Catharanthus roseus TaxID=4058 RepID=A0ACB9ZT68_CATRO|nr:hypothetical protein M9H77_36919 [Catharanthus roseus]